VQRSPILLLAVKKNVDENKKYGRFLLIGSSNVPLLPSVTESFAGRITNIRLRPLSMGEICGEAPNFIKRSFDGTFGMGAGKRVYNKDDYLCLALVGGYPEANALPEKQSSKWHQDYINVLKCA
jgi:uncharacterized protein